jgi:hypothetical protein
MANGFARYIGLGRMGNCISAKTISRKFSPATIRRPRKPQQPRAKQAFFAVFTIRRSGVDPAAKRSYNRPTVMDGKASFFC